MDRTEQLRREGAVADLLVAAIGLVFLCAAPALLIPQPEPTMSTTKKFPEPQAFSDKPRPQIELKSVDSSQVGAIGYDPATKTLAVQFKRGTGSIYHYPDVSPETHAAFMGAESIGTYFGKHIKGLPFTKFQPDAKFQPDTASA